MAKQTNARNATPQSPNVVRPWANQNEKQNNHQMIKQHETNKQTKQTQQTNKANKTTPK